MLCCLQKRAFSSISSSSFRVSNVSAIHHSALCTPRLPHNSAWEAFIWTKSIAGHHHRARDKYPSTSHSPPASTNQNFTVRGSRHHYVVQEWAATCSLHGVVRANELSTPSRAAGLTPAWSTRSRIVVFQLFITRRARRRTSANPPISSALSRGRWVRALYRDIPATRTCGKMCDCPCAVRGLLGPTRSAKARADTVPTPPDTSRPRRAA